MVAKNDTSNVSVGKGVAGGYAFSAPATVAVPTDYKTPLPEGFVNLGYITEDGIEFSYDSDTEDFNDMNGDTIESSEGAQTEEVILTLAETMKDSLSEAYGHSNVTATDDTLTVKHNSESHQERVYVFELLLKNGRKWRVVVPRGTARRSSSVTVNKTNLIGYQVTIKCLPNTDGDRMIDYIQVKNTDSLALSNLTKEQLVIEAESMGLNVPKSATKVEIISMISEKGIQ